MNVFAELDLYMNRGMLLHAEVKCTPYGKIRPFQPKNRPVLRCSTGGCALPKRPEMPCFQAFSGGCICIFVRTALMTVIDVILCHFAFVDLAFLCQEIRSECFLKQGVSLVFFIPECIRVDTMCAVGASVGANGCIA